jgi:hypothetical protein
MSALPPDVLPELEKEYREWQAQLDVYISQWKAAVQLLEEKGYKPHPHTAAKAAPEGGKPQSKQRGGAAKAALSRPGSQSAPGR